MDLVGRYFYQVLILKHAMDRKIMLEFLNHPIKMLSCLYYIFIRQLVSTEESLGGVKERRMTVS